MISVGDSKEVLYLPTIFLFFCICARSQLREITACAFSSSSELVALISEEMTLLR
jgi:hypothetical protein